MARAVALARPQAEREGFSEEAHITAYGLSRVHVMDAETYARYATLAGSAIETRGGMFLARGGKQVIPEGAA